MSIQYCYNCDKHIDTDEERMEDHECTGCYNSLDFIFGNPIKQIEDIIEELKINKNLCQ